MPQLEVLRVQHCRAAWDDEDAQGVRVALPHLRLVAFRDTTPRRFALLCAHVDAPPTVRRHLFWRLWTVAGWERWEQLLETMHGFVPRESAPGADDGGLQVVRVAGGPARGSFCAWTRSAVAPATSTSQDDALFQVDVDWKESPAEPSGVLGRASPFFHLAGLCGHLRTTHVDGLLIDPDVDGHVDCADATATYWASLASVLPSVRAVWLHKGAPSVLRAVTPGSLLPNLQKLFIVRTTIRSPIEVSEGLLWNFRSRLGPRESPEPGVRDAMGVMGEDLFAFVRNRDGIEVILVGCDVDAGFLDMLRKHAQVDVGEEWVYV
ncbi:hypothetical protein BC834DRAFT_877175 [Gloeopeniophorella convolvens]|nr:hypothetical protein BC834DRAFT_877175 [Gloeopeniophorella convolvens]